VVRVRRRLALSLTAITQLVIDHSDNRSLWPLARSSASETPAPRSSSEKQFKRAQIRSSMPPVPHHTRSWKFVPWGQLRDIATVMFLEAVQKNYGKAGEYSKEFFDQAQRIQSSTEDPALRNLLRDTLATRDQITADLAKGDPAALSEIQPLLSKIEQTAKH
jgi:hypothetical protein